MSAFDFTVANFTGSDRKCRYAFDLMQSFMCNAKAGHPNGVVGWWNHEKEIIKSLKEELTAKGWKCGIEYAHGDCVSPEYHFLWIAYPEQKQQ